MTQITTDIQGGNWNIFLSDHDILNMGELKEEPVVFKVFYEEPIPSSSDHNQQIGKEVRKLVFSNLPNFRQLYDRLVRIEQEKQNACGDNVDSSSIPILKNIRMAYIDEDGDRISIACNDDLQILVNEKVGDHETKSV